MSTIQSAVTLLFCVESNVLSNFMQGNIDCKLTFEELWQQWASLACLTAWMKIFQWRHTHIQFSFKSFDLIDIFATFQSISRKNGAPGVVCVRGRFDIVHAVFTSNSVCDIPRFHRQILGRSETLREYFAQTFRGMYLISASLFQWLR